MLVDPGIIAIVVVFALMAWWANRYMKRHPYKPKDPRDKD